MERLTGRFEASGSDGANYTVLVYTTLTVEGGAEVVSGERLATSDGLTVFAFPGGLYRTTLTGVWLARERREAR